MAPSNLELAQVTLRTWRAALSRIRSFLAAHAAAEQVRNLPAFEAVLEETFREAREALVALEEAALRVMVATWPERDSVLQAESELAIAVRAEADLLRFRVSEANGPPPPVVREGPAKLPKISFRPLDREDPRLWFGQFEDVLAGHLVVDQIQRFVALTSLLNAEEGRIIAALTAAVPRPPDVYDQAKALVVARYEPSTYRRLGKAFALGNIDRGGKATSWMADFRGLTEEATLEDIRKWAMLRRLPEEVRIALSAPDPDIDSTALAVRADAALEALSRQPPVLVGAVAAPPAVTELATAPVAAVRKPSNACTCFYHARFGQRALFCERPDPADPNRLPLPEKGRKEAKKPAGNAQGKA